jgi:hypothetical protein
MCNDMVDEQGNTIPASELQCEVDPQMEMVAETHATWYGAPPPLFCAPRSKIAQAPRWDYNGWCPSSGTSWNQKDVWAEPFGSMSRGQIYYSNDQAHVPPEVLAVSPTYIDYVKGAVDAGTGEDCLLEGTCCMDVADQKAGSWQSCEGGCANADPSKAVSGKGRTDVEGCCWWGRGVIQTTGICNFGKLNYFLGKKAADRGAAALYPDVDFCRDPGEICRGAHPDLKWVAGFFYWLETVQPYDKRGAEYMRTLHAWVDAGAHLSDHTLIDMASGIVNRGCHDAPHSPSEPDPCGNGVLDAVEERRRNFAEVMNAFKDAGVWPSETLELRASTLAGMAGTSRRARNHAALPTGGIVLGLSALFVFVVLAFGGSRIAGQANHWRRRIFHWRVHSDADAEAELTRPAGAWASGSASRPQRLPEP